MVEIVTAESISTFLRATTPVSWLQYASSHVEELLIDHALCEKKAASTALCMMYRYTDKPELLHFLSRLAREELRHFEQVLRILSARGISYTPQGPGRYAASLHRLIRKTEPMRLIDTLIVGAFIEARSCERFSSLLPYLDDELSAFYRKLHQAEARHFQTYLALAKQFSEEDLSDRIALFAEAEATLITEPDDHFRFHSGKAD